MLSPKAIRVKLHHKLYGICAYMYIHVLVVYYSCQVSKHEKFGYGCMATQLASTAAGTAELNKCGKLYIDDPV